MNTELQDKLIRELMSKSSDEMPFIDFEDKLMKQIHQEAKQSRSILKNIKLSWFFFIVGAIFGIFLSTISSQLNETILGFPSQQIILFIQIVFVILLLTQFDNLLELTKRRDQ